MLPGPVLPGLIQSEAGTLFHDALDVRRVGGTGEVLNLIP